MKIFAKIRFYWGAAIIALNTAILMIPAILIFNRHKNIFLHYINKMTMFMMGAKWEMEGTMDPDADLFIMNHQGIMDIVAMEAMQKNHLRWVAKKNFLKHHGMDFYCKKPI
jgi:1-acyl-sn-glycerol-3-phosphate acyltransferase